MSIFGESNEGFSLAPGGDDGAPTPPRKKPVTPPARNNVNSGNSTPPPARRMPTRVAPARRPTTPPPASVTPVKPPVHKPVYQEPEYVEPEVQYEEPYTPQKPVYQEPEPIYQEPEPVYQEPEPVYQESTPIVQDRSSGIPEMPTAQRRTPTQSAYEDKPYNPPVRDSSYNSAPDNHYEQSVPRATYESYPDDNYKDSIPNQKYPFGGDDVRPIRQNADMNKMPESVSRYSDSDEVDYMEERLKSRLNDKPKIHNQYDEDDEDDFEEEKPKRSSNRSSARKTSRNPTRNNKKDTKPSKKKGMARKNKEDKPPSQFFGDRKRVLVTNITAGILLLSILGVGANAIFNSPYIPSPDDMSALVNEELNITKFDKEAAKPIVSSFTKEYFTHSPEEDKAKKLSAYTTDTIAGEISGSLVLANGVKQSLSGEPQILKIEAMDDNNAIYTVGSKIGSNWLYIEVPVFYNDATKSYAVSGIPSFIPPPTIAEIGAEIETPESDLESDVEVTEQTEENVRSFLKAWASSDAEALSRYITNDATRETRLGLQNTAYFSSLENYEVYYTPEGTTDEENIRTATMTVTWGNSAKNPTVKYNQNFELKLYKQPDNRWYIADISTAKTSYSTEMSQEQIQEKEQLASTAPTE